MARPHVRILSRYILRQHLPPLGYAIAALTFAMLVNQVAKQFGNFVGKGLPWGAIFEVFALSIPFIVAMTLPMAVLVAVLYTFSHLAAANTLNDVTIYDLQDPDRRRIIMADSGRMAYSGGGTDLYLTLRDGEVHEIRRTDPEHFNRTFYTINRIKVAGVSNTFETTKHDEYRSDREMGICAMQDVVARARQDLERVRIDALNAVAGELRRVSKLAPLRPVAADTTSPRPSMYCRVLGVLQRLLPGSPPAARAAEPGTGEAAPPAIAVQDVTTPAAYAQRLRAARQRAAIYEVEIQKKLAISAACVIFALLGVPLAIRYPRGGVGLVIGTSLAVFSVYYVGLIGGEEFGDRLIVPPFFSMWTPNLIFLIVSIPLLWTARHAGSTAHGGDWEEVKQTFLGWIPKMRIRL